MNANNTWFIYAITDNFFYTDFKLNDTLQVRTVMTNS